MNKVKYWYPSDKIIYATGCDVGETQDYSYSSKSGVKFMYNVGAEIKKRNPEKRSINYETWHKLGKGIGVIL